MTHVRGEIRGADSVVAGGRVLMYIRCAHCHGATQVPPPCVGRDVTCETCGQKHSLERAHLLGSTPLERHKRIVEYSDAHCVDLASACSILLGILPSGDAIVVRESRESRAEKPPEQDGALDPGFARAIAEGLITRSEALRRGNRRAYASGLAQRHKLALPVALLVADNRMRLERALSRTEAAASNHEQTEVQVQVLDEPVDRALWKWLVLPIVIVLGALVVWNHQRGPNPQADVSNQVAEPVASNRDVISLTGIEPLVQKDPTDAVARITASHPRDVLVAFCMSGPDPGSRTPLRVEPAGNAWVGVYEETGRTFRLFIMRDEQDVRRFSTNGRPPIEITPQATLATNG